ncbi:RNase LS family HEPN domain-containing protein [Bordetella bronchialis]
MSKVGQNVDLSERLAAFVAERTQRAPAENRPFALGNIPSENWGFLLQYLTDNGCKITEEPLQYGQRFKVVGPQRDQVVLHRYDTGKFLMQGRHMAVYAMVAATLCELHEDKREVLEAQLEVVPVNATVDGLFDELQEHLPTAANYLGETGRAILAPSIALTKIAVELPDYSVVAFPALRGLEFYMKQLLVDKGFSVSPKQGLGAYFTAQGALLASYAQKLNCPHTVEALEKAYEIHAQHRNGLFHADGFIPEMTRVVSDKADAVSIVYHVLRTIETSYAKISGTAH